VTVTLDFWARLHNFATLGLAPPDWSTREWRMAARWRHPGGVEGGRVTMAGGSGGEGGQVGAVHVGAGGEEAEELAKEGATGVTEVEEDGKNAGDFENEGGAVGDDARAMTRER
jgi:hypothetical protein